MSGKPANVRWLDDFKDPARRKRLEAHMRSVAERYARIKEAVREAKRKNWEPVLTLISEGGGDDLRQAIEDADVLPGRKKRGRDFSPVGLAVKRVRLMLKRQRLSGQPVDYGSVPALVKRMIVMAMVAKEDADFPYLTFGPDANVEEISERVLKTLRKGKRRTKKAHLG
jgi:hypothetical protein